VAKVWSEHFKSPDQLVHVMRALLLSPEMQTGFARKRSAHWNSSLASFAPLGPTFDRMRISTTSWATVVSVYSNGDHPPDTRTWPTIGRARTAC